MEGKEIYTEKLSFPHALFLAPGMGLISLVFLGIFFYQFFGKPILPAWLPNWINLIIFFFFFRFFILFVNFRSLCLTISEGGILISFGLIKRKILWEKIDEIGVLHEKVRLLWWRLPIDWRKGRWRNAFQVIGYPQVRLLIQDPRFSEVVFSTEKPELVKKIIERKLASLRSGRGGSGFAGEVVGSPNPDDDQGSTKEVKPV